MMPQPLHDHDHVISVGGADINGPPHNQVICVFDQACVFPDLPIGVKNHCALRLGNFVYCIGGREQGFDDYIGSERVWRMNINACSNEIKWKSITPMNEGRTEFGATVYRMNGQEGIIVAGGCDRAAATAEFYSPSQNIWESLPDLNRPRYGNALVAHEKSVYAIGGKNIDGAVLDTIEVFKVNAWQVATCTLKRPRYLFAAVSYHEDIYVIGGWNKSTTALKSAESVFAKREWSMRTARCKHAACVLNDRIFVVGGLTNIVVNQQFERLRTTEQFDGQAWMEEHEIENELFRHAIVSI